MHSLLWICAGWVLGNMLPFFFILKLLGFLRVPAEEETLGIDESYHGGHAYPGHGAEYDSSMSKSNGNANGNGQWHGQNDSGVSFQAKSCCMLCCTARRAPVHPCSLAPDAPINQSWTW